MVDDPRIARAEADVEDARERLVATLHGISRRLEPKRLLGDLWDGAKSKGADLAEEAVDAVCARPIAAGGAVAALALFLAREPLIELAGKATKGIGKSKKKLPAERKPAERKKIVESKNDPEA